VAGPTTAERGGDRRQRPAGPRQPAGRPARLLGLRRRTAVLLLAVLAVLLGGFGAWALYGSNWLRIERVSVHWQQGPRELTEEQIIEAASVPVGSPMASLDKGAVRDRLLERLPRLESVEVVRGWPHGVTLKVTEREPELLVPRSGGYTQVDDDGVAFAETRSRLPGVPVLEMALEDSPSRHRFDEERVLRHVAAMAAELPAELRDQVRLIRVTSYDALTLQLTGDRTVRWGSPEDTRAKAEALARVMDAAGEAAYFDVSVPSAPAVSGG
jgi:cell division protein FtsQ